MNRKHEIASEIKKTKNLNKLLRLSKSFIDNEGGELFYLLEDKITSFEKNKNFQEKFLHPILIHSCKTLDLKSLNFFFTKFEIQANFELLFSLLYYSIRKFNVFKYVYDSFNLNLNGKYAVVLLLFVQHTNKKLAKDIIDHIDLNCSSNIEQILSFLLEAKEHECFKKYTKYEYAFSDFILDFDYENKAISKYPLYKDRISDFDKHVYEERYKNYLMKKVNSF